VSSQSQSYYVAVDLFSGSDLPRSYLSQAKLDFTAQGAAIAGGLAKRQRRVWAVTGLLSAADAARLDALFRAWDADRGRGLAAVVGIEDDTGPGSAISATGYITTPPRFTQAGPDWLASIGVTEV
jgi:hypothetical protein